MKINYTFSVVTARDPALRSWRENNYDPEVLHDTVGSLSDVINCLDDVVSGASQGRSYHGNKYSSYEEYDGEIVERIGQGTPSELSTHIQISNIKYPPTNPLREGWNTVIRHAVGVERPSFGQAYRVSKFAGNIASMKVTDYLDGVSAALVLGSPSLVRAVGWRDGTQYDATVLCEELRRLHSLQ